MWQSSVKQALLATHVAILVSLEPQPTAAPLRKSETKSRCANMAGARVAQTWHKLEASIPHPRIPLAPDFKAFAKAGKKLADLHLNYESLEPWPLEWIETEGVPLSYEVEKMRLSKDKTQLKVNESLTLGKIPPEVFDYRLGNRSALDWVIDQYQKKTDNRSGIESDPNNPDDLEYIVRLVGQVVRVSVETVKIVEGLPEDYGAKA